MPLTRLTTPRAPQRWWCAYAGGAGLLVAVCAALPPGVAQELVYLVVSASAVAAIITGARVHRPVARGAWYWLAAGQLSWFLGDVLWFWYAYALQVEPYPSPADLLYLLGYPLLATGLIFMVRTRRRGLDLAGLIDSSIVTISCGLVSWVVLAGPVARSSEESLLARVVGVAYPAADILLLAVLVRLVIGPGSRVRALTLLVASATAALVADSAFALLEATGGWNSDVTGMLWLSGYVLMGAAALHPSMRLLTLTPGSPSAAVSRRRLTALTAAVLVAPSTLAVQLALGLPTDAWAVVLASVLLFGLVVARMDAALRQLTRSRAQRDRLQDDLAHQAAHDPLTALANRARALELVQAALHRGQRSGSLVGLLFVDLDHFKAVNDTFGHRTGDDVLRATAGRMLAVVRAGDAVGRLGGDEFVVLVESPESEEALLELAERLVAAVSAPVATGGRTVAVGASVGVAVSRDGGTDAAALLHDADVAAYRAKGAGRGRVEVFDDALRRELEERAALEAAIRRGLDGGEFLLHYQPVVTVVAGPSGPRTAEGTVEGYEALLRWDRPGHGMVPPDAFIPTAERSTLVCDLGRWALREATLQLARWAAATPPTGVVGPATSVAVNISGRHLASPGIVDDVAAALAASGVAAHRLVLEITETVLVDEPTATAHLAGLRALGVGISIDDFGTGYTSIGQLQHLHADTLKIDRSLVASTAPGSAELVRLVVHAAHAFGLSVVAEGVEHEHQLSPLRQAGCDSAQGYLFARPQPAAAIAQPAAAITQPAAAITPPAAASAQPAAVTPRGGPAGSR